MPEVMFSVAVTMGMVVPTFIALDTPLPVPAGQYEPTGHRVQFPFVSTVPEGHTARKQRPCQYTVEVTEQGLQRPFADAQQHHS
jgi:hypothetical protein